MTNVLIVVQLIFSIFAEIQKLSVKLSQVISEGRDLTEEEFNDIKAGTINARKSLEEKLGM